MMWYQLINIIIGDRYILSNHDTKIEIYHKEEMLWSENFRKKDFIRAAPKRRREYYYLFNIKEKIKSSKIDFRMKKLLPQLNLFRGYCKIDKEGHSNLSYKIWIDGNEREEDRCFLILKDNEGIKYLAEMKLCNKK